MIQMQKNKMQTAVLALLIVIIALLFGQNMAGTQQSPAPSDTSAYVTLGQVYSDKDHVAQYIHAFSALPPNYITKNEAEKLGWVAGEGNLWDVAPGKSIGGDRFGNYEKQLPSENGVTYRECDIDFDGKYRNAKRIVYSDDGRVYYTDDHYETFEEVPRLP